MPEKTTEHNNSEPRTPRLKLLVLFLLVAGFTLWFHRHLYLYVTEVLLVGGTLTAWSLWKALQPWVQKGLGDEKSRAIKALESPRANEYLVFAGLLLVVLYAFTSSIYVQYDSGRASESRYRVVAVRNGNPYLDTMTVTSVARVTGGPSLFEIGTRELVFQIVEPPGYLPVRRQLHPWDRVRLRVPGDFERRDVYVLRIIPGAGVYALLAAPDKEDPPSVYRLTARRSGPGGSLTRALDDVRKGMIYGGAEQRVMDWLLDQAEADRTRERIRSYLSKFGGKPDQIEPVLRELELHTRFFEGIEFGAGDTVRIELGKPGEEPVASDVIVLESPGVTNLFLETPR